MKDLKDAASFLISQCIPKVLRKDFASLRVSPIDGAIAELSEAELQATSSYDQGVYDSLVVATERRRSSMPIAVCRRGLLREETCAAVEAQPSPATEALHLTGSGPSLSAASGLQ